MKINKYLNQKFKRLLIVEIIPDGKNPIAKYLCDCGKHGQALLGNIRAGRTVSCGCRLKETWNNKITHGFANTSTYTSWESMINRCTHGNVQNKINPQYTKRMVCNEWKKFDNFLKDMGERPPNTSLDRINNNLGYFKENCRWATRKEQSNNIKNNIVIEFENKKQTLSMWVREKQIPYTTAFARYRAGLPLEIVFTKGKLTKNSLKKLF